MNCSPDIRQKVIEFFKQGQPHRKIASRLAISKSGVSRIIKRYKETGSEIPRRKVGSGGRKSLTVREIRRLKAKSLADPTLNAAQIQAAIGGKCQHLSLRSIQRYLNRAGCLAYRPSKSPALNRKQQRTRYLWALDHQDHDWSGTVFSDETYICLQTSTAGQFVRRQKNQPVTLKHSKQHRAFQKKILVWGCIDANGPGPIEVFRGSMDSAKYLSIIEEHIIPHAWEMTFFQQDNAPPHKAKLVVDRFKEMNLPLLQWPPYSPDANCIENIWALLKQKVRSRNPRTMCELHDTILDIWWNDASLKEACKAVVKSMPKRISSLLKSRGGFIKY